MGGIGDEVEPPVVFDEVVELGVDLAEFQAQLAQELEAFFGVMLRSGRGGESLGHAFPTRRPLLRLVDDWFGAPQPGRLVSGNRPESS